MTGELRIDPDLATMAVTSARFNVLGRLHKDLSTISTWDPGLSRQHRILVPVDVQGYVVQPGGAEPVVRVCGHPGDDEPFAPGQPLDTGVHLHWAMPDALLQARHDETTKAVAAPPLPDQWVVVRTLQPSGRREVLTTGWVIDARLGTVTPLSSFTGPAPIAPSDPPPVLRVTTHGLLWTASYAGSAGRFSFRDPLDDLAELRKASAPQGFAGDQATYTVAGWWRHPADDPLTDANGPAELDRTLATLRWRVDHDADDKDREALSTYHTLLHGSVLGVPVTGAVPAADDRPTGKELTVAVGTDTDDVVAAFGADGLGLDTDDRVLAEDLMAAFSMGSVARLGTTDGLDEIGQREHENGFWSLPGAALPRAHPDRLRTEDTLAAGPSKTGRKGRSAEAAAREGVANEGAAGKTGKERFNRLAWKSTFDLEDKPGKGGSVPSRGRTEEALRPPGREPGESRSVTRPAPRYFRPQPLVVAVRGARPSPRHHGDGRFDADGKLLCRYAGAAVSALADWVTGAGVLPSLGSGAVPPEVLTVVREAVLLNPYAIGWLTAAGGDAEETVEPAGNRVAAELVRVHGKDGRYTGVTTLGGSAIEEVPDGWEKEAFLESLEMQRITIQLAQHSAMNGTPPSPVALTTWRQPWAPLWLEWQVTVRGGSSLRGWRLRGYDLEPDPDGPGGIDDVAATFTGRGAVGHGVGEALRAGVRSWLASEQSRAVTNHTAPYGSAPVLAQLAALDRPLDLVSASLDGLREQLLGIDFLGVVARDEDGRPTASRPPVTLFGGRLRVDRLRLVDAFGRTLELPEEALESLATTVELEVDDGEDAGRSLRMRPRFQGSARWLLRLVDAAQPPGTPADTLREAYVDQLKPEAASNPVAGFLLPDHVDESLEVFTSGGIAIGELGHDAIGTVTSDGDDEEIVHAVRWDPAPGRAVRADAGPLVEVAAQDRLVAEIAAGLLRADAKARALPAEVRPGDSALVNLLRVVDTTLWTVDTFAGLGAGSLAGLVGRPIAVVRAALKLEVPDDLAEVTVTAPGGTAERKAAFRRLADELVEVRLGTVTRTDDALLGYFVDDDYEHLHVVDKGLAEHARHTGRTIGQLGLLGQATAPAEKPLDHPYLVTDGTLRVRPGQTTVLTLLMLPMGKVHVTSGVLPRKAIGLAESWFAQGLNRVTPSVRVGPLLVDPAEIRLPLVTLLGDKQTFSRRTGELAWRNDPILAATQTAYLPLTPHEVEEGWIRVTPDEDDRG